MGTIFTYIWDFRFIIITTIAASLYVLLEWQKAKSTLYALMLQAKRLAKDAILSSGEQQEQWVLNKAKLFLPVRILVFLPDERLRYVIKALFDLAKDYLDDGKRNGTNGLG